MHEKVAAQERQIAAMQESANQVMYSLRATEELTIAVERDLRVVHSMMAIEMQKTAELQDNYNLVKRDNQCLTQQLASLRQGVAALSRQNAVLFNELQLAKNRLGEIRDLATLP